MKVTVKLYGELKRLSSFDELAVDVDENSTVGDLIKMLGIGSGEVWVIAVNQHMTEKDYLLHQDDQISLVPPIGGGSK
jgi:molybdopterin converting factor small subunit